MATFKAHKVVAALPGVLVADAVYAVRVGEGFDLYITDSTGSIAHKINAALNWTDYVSRGDGYPVLVGAATSPVAGTVYAHTLGGVTRYRLIPTPYSMAEDAFYANFASGACTGLLARRNQS